MSPEALALFASRESQLSLLRELVSALQEAQAAIVAADVVTLEHCNIRQLKICIALSKTNCDDNPAQATATPDLDDRWKALSQEIDDTAQIIQYLNRVQQGLLRRARFTVEIFFRILASADLTYAPQSRTDKAYLGK